MMIKELQWKGSSIYWKIEQQNITVTCDWKIVNALVLKSGGVASVEAQDQSSKAKIWNNDGSLRVELKSPFRSEDGVEFYYFNYESDKLVVILTSTLRDFVCEVDENCGLLSNLHETR